MTPVTESKSLLNISSRSATPQTGSKTTPQTGSKTTPHSGSKITPQSGRRSMPTTGSKTTPHGSLKVTRLVDISGDDDDDDDEAAVTQFGRLKVGFTPGMDGKSRRVRVFLSITSRWLSLTAVISTYFWILIFCWLLFNWHIFLSYHRLCWISKVTRWHNG